ncbi:MAG TPA: CRISPR-associated endonuclease Cas3'' [Xanthomonadaceae bacterium]|nr:CRISPR-associated endonuclease Cas3'' [Xanthomonadaceae bacterium]
MAFARAIKSPGGEWRFQPLEDHLAGVSERAGRFAAPIGSGELAALAGLWHDLGKYAADFQRYLLDANGIDVERENASIEGVGRRVDHSAAGALLAMDRLGPCGKILAQLIAAHHHGLYDAADLVERLDRSRKAGRLVKAMAGEPPESILDREPPPFPRIPGHDDPARRPFALYLRMMFSCLVDADVLDSEAFGDPASASVRGDFSPLSDIKAGLDRHLAAFQADSAVNRIRAEVLAECRQAAGAPQGLFTLTVPTGGGKTLSSMAFALDHALHHGFRRVIYVIPYTSIIEQTADVFRGIFGNAVVEHHSNLDPEHETQRSRLASENWDAPVVVTTNVQFFESLFSARTSRCRKLHNILQSVVVLDEAQLLPPDYLQPIVDVLHLLTTSYPMSAVLCTATQPVLASREAFGSTFKGLDHAREIVGDPQPLYRALKRVTVTRPEDLQTPTTWEALAERIVAEDCVLAIVNRRDDARALHALLPVGSVHLSALMCGAHRADTIALIKERLETRRHDAQAQPLRVVSTQLVEAGVDIDFPVVFRAMAGLDSIAQAAGRCNREGHLPEGRLHIFVPPKGAPPGLLKLGEQITRSLLWRYRGDPLDPGLLARYFEAFYRDCELDRHDINGLLKPDSSGGVVAIRDAADRFRLVADDQIGILVPYSSDPDDKRFAGLLAALRKQGPSRGLFRSLQRFVVSLPRWQFEHMRHAGDIEEVLPEFWALISEVQYDATLGLLLDTAGGNRALMV